MRKSSIVIVLLMVFFFTCLMYELANNDWGYDPTGEPYDIFNSSYEWNGSEGRLGPWEIEVIG